jgi:hypothetical protein
MADFRRWYVHGTNYVSGVKLLEMGGVSLESPALERLVKIWFPAFV